MSKRPKSLTIKEIREKIKDPSTKIVFETKGVTRVVTCLKCGGIWWATFFLKKYKPTDSVCPTCKETKKIRWATKEQIIISEWLDKKYKKDN